MKRSQHKSVVNLDDVEFHARPERMTPQGSAAGKFDVRTAHLGQLLGARKLGYNVSAVPPGRAAFPFHSHRVNEEMFLVLSGTGEVRIGDETFPLREGDVMACPAGGPETAHQIINNGDEELRYLAVSTQLSPEICDYPDSRKFGVYALFAGDGDQAHERFFYMGRPDMTLDYWDGEGDGSDAESGS